MLLMVLAIGNAWWSPPIVGPFLMGVVVVVGGFMFLHE